MFAPPGRTLDIKMLTLDDMRQSDLMHARRFADAMTHMLEHFIPRNSRRDAWEFLTDAALRDGFELTSRDMRRQYEAWKRTELEIMSITPLAPKIDA
jgi:hypothetical protein